MTLDHYQLTKGLGSGSFCKVYLGLNTENGEHVAIKILNGKALEADIIKEILTLKTLEGHENVLRCLGCNEGILNKPTKPNKYPKKVNYIIFEIAPGGELFDFVALSAFDLATTRCYFRQLVTGLYFCQQKDVCHRDLKLENILVGEGFKLKIADFGMAAPASGKYEDDNGNAWLKTYCGTASHMAPEIHLQ